MAALKYSRQRESIYEFIKSRKDHPTADIVYENIRKIYPNISLGTVYRNLSVLESIGSISKVTAGDGAIRYDGNMEPHNHFICTGCNCVKDLETENMDEIIDQISSQFDGLIDRCEMNFYGICSDCLKAEKKPVQDVQ